MKKLLAVLFTLLLMLPVTLFAEEKAKVKVYVFEAGGCPFCEAQHKYLEGLDGYNKTFEVISKELYVDHVNWEHGKDYDLGVKVVEAFNKKGFKDASYEGTPLVVISDLYAAATYSTSLESIINEAYAEGDKDAVSCIENATSEGYNCIKTQSESTEKESNAGLVVLILAGVVFVGAIIYIVSSKSNSPLEENDEEERVEEVKKEAPKKEAQKKAAPKKEAPKKTVSKTTTSKKSTSKKVPAKKTNSKTQTKSKTSKK